MAYAARAAVPRKEKPAGCRSEEQTQTSDRRTEPRTEEQKQVPLTRRGFPSPSPLNNRNGLILLEGVEGGGWGEVAQGCLPPVWPL